MLPVNVAGASCAEIASGLVSFPLLLKALMLEEGSTLRTSSNSNHAQRPLAALGAELLGGVVFKPAQPPPIPLTLSVLDNRAQWLY